MTVPETYNLPKALTPKTITLEIRVPKYESWRTHNSVHNNNVSICHYPLPFFAPPPPKICASSKGPHGTYVMVVI